MTDPSDVGEMIARCVSDIRMAYADEVDDISCTVADAATLIEIRCTFTLFCDNLARDRVVKLGSVISADQDVRRRYVESALQRLRSSIEDEIATTMGTPGIKRLLP